MGQIVMTVRAIDWTGGINMCHVLTYDGNTFAAETINNSIMETNNIFDGAYSRIIEDEAWQRLARIVKVNAG